MAGHWLSRVVCFLAGHAEMLWTFGPTGTVWTCPRCGRQEHSRALRRVR